MYIAICEDNPADREILADLCNQHAQNHGTAVEYNLFENTAALLADERVMRMNAVILDIQMNGAASGVEAARTLRQRGYKGALVFVTVSADYYAEGFEVGALHYLVKPVRYDEFEEAMNRVTEKQGLLAQTITVMSNRKQVDIPLGHILCATVNGHKTVLHTTVGTVSTSLSFADMEALLSDSRFLKCYRSCIINMEQVERVEETEFLLKNGKHAPITQRRAAQVKAHYMHYIFGKEKHGI